MVDPWLIGLAAAFGPQLAKLISGGDDKPVRVSRACADKCSRVELGSRHFDRDVSDKIPPLLAGYSAVPLPSSKFAPTARVYRLIPLRPDVPSALSELERARAEGRVVAGTLSLIYLSKGQPSGSLLVACHPRDARRLTTPAGQLAVIDPPAPPAAEAPVEVAPTPEPEAKGAEPVAAAKEATNGAYQESAAKKTAPRITKPAEA